jgi:PAS domain S-box-containing protein
MNPLIHSVVTWLEATFRDLPLPLLEVWGRIAFILGFVLAVYAFGGFTFRLGKQWGLGREQQAWDAKAFLAIPLTFLLIVVTGYLGSFIVLVPGAQTLESLKDLVVFVCILLFGYPALITVPFAYGLSDLIEGVPPEFLLDWLPGYFINPTCFWIAYQLFGKNPDFRRLAVWGRYLLFVVVFLALEPVLWGYLCAGKFTAEISYRTITPALFFTTGLTWLIAPFAMLGALPLARKFGLFWADIPGHVKEQAVGLQAWIWEAGKGRQRGAGEAEAHWPIRMFLLAPFIVLTLVMVGTTAYITLRSAATDAGRLATRLHQEISENINLRLDAYLARLPADFDPTRGSELDALLANLPITRDGRAFILNRQGEIVASPIDRADAVTLHAAGSLIAEYQNLEHLDAGFQYRFDHVTAEPLSRETWLAYASAYRDRRGGRADWILVTVMPETYYLAGVHAGNSRSAMVFAIALLLSLAVAAALASMVTAPLRRIVQATRAIAQGDLAQRVPPSGLDELGTLADSFNEMAAQLKQSFDNLFKEVEIRTRREIQLQESEARLRTSEQRMQLAVGSAGLAIWDWDVEKDRLVWDDSMYRLYGLRKEEFSGAYEAWVSCLLPEDAARTRDDIRAALRGEREFNPQFRIRWKDGSIRQIKAAAMTLRDANGRAIRMVGINWDETDKQRSELEREQLVHDLRERVKELRLLHNTARLLQQDRPVSKALLQELVAQIPGAWQHSADCEARIVYRKLEVATPGWRDTAWKQAAAFVTGHGTGMIEVAYTREYPQSAEGPFLAEERTLLDSLADMLTRYLELRGYREELEALIATRTQELLVAKDVAETANQAKSAFLANMSHEIRTPMNAVIGMTHLALNAEPPPRLRDYLQKIQYSSRSLLRIINDLLDFSKIEAGKLTLETVPFNLDKTLNEVAGLVGLHAENKGLEVIFDTAPDVPEILIGDPLRLSQVLTNLCGNATKFTEKGEIRVVTRLLPAKDGSVTLRIAVSDTGIGITDEQKQHLFQSFSQADSSTTRKFGGTGLGLTICKRLVEMMGGVIGFESEYGVGSTFFFTVTLKRPAEPAPPRPAAGVFQGRRVLVVDDNAYARDVLTETLIALGFETQGVRSGMDAMTELGKKSPRYDLVLMDWQMPELDGIETIRRIQRGRKNRELPCILMVTAHGREEAMQQANKLHVDAFLIKPVSRSLLFDALIQLFGHPAPENPAQTAQTAKASDTLDTSVRTLVVEDHILNQELMLAYLASLNLHAEVALTGREALRKHEQTPYDLILSDIQMPEMDGMEMLAEIRRREKKYSLPRVKAVAISASARQEELDRYLESGFDACLPKPMEFDTLVALLHTIIGLHRNAAGGTIIDLAPIQRNFKDPKRLQTLMENYLQSSIEDLAALRKAVHARNPDSILHIAHRIKGAAKSIGAALLTGLCEKLEHAGKQRELHNTETLLAEFTEASAHVNREICLRFEIELPANTAG